MSGLQEFDEAEARSIARSFDLTLLPPDYYDDPYPYYRALREYDPVHLLPTGGYFLTRYSDCLFVYKDARLFSSDKKSEFAPKFGKTPLYDHHTTSLVFNDPPLHTRVRRIIAGSLSPRAVSAMESLVTELVDQLLGSMDRKQAARGSIDLIEDFAAAIPVEVIGNLLAIPREERGPLRTWSLAILGALEPKLSTNQVDRGNQAVFDFLDYLRGLVADRRRKPGDPEIDVLTRLIKGERSGDHLSEVELLHNVIFILNAGHETTTNLIGNGLHALLMWPDEKRRLIEEPRLIGIAIEEMLRFESSNQLGNRITTSPVEIGGVPIPAGTSITIGIGAGNRDPREFPDPERFDIARQPNRHLAFGSGSHACVGLAVARLEGRIAISRLLTRFPGYRLAGDPVRGGRARFRGFAALPAWLA